MLRGVIFDMDGTLTVPAIDFAAMRRQLGIPTGDILTTVWAWPAERQAWAFDIIEGLEAEARRKLAIQPGADELLAFLDARGLEKGIVTRNTPTTVAHLLARLRSPFSAVITREFTAIKPDPAPVLHICRQWGVAPKHVLMVGDYRDDLLCGRAAGSITCLLRNDRNGEFAALADHVADSLTAVRDVVAALLPRAPAAG